MRVEVTMKWLSHLFTTNWNITFEQQLKNKEIFKLIELLVKNGEIEINQYNIPKVMTGNYDDDEKYREFMYFEMNFNRWLWTRPFDLASKISDRESFEHKKMKGQLAKFFDERGYKVEKIDVSNEEFSKHPIFKLIGTYLPSFECGADVVADKYIECGADIVVDNYRVRGECGDTPPYRVFNHMMKVPYYSGAEEVWVYPYSDDGIVTQFIKTKKYGGLSGSEEARKCFYGGL